MSTRTILAAAAALALSAGAALAEDYAGGAIKTMESSGSEVLTDAKGMTLYIFDKDSAGMSNCYEQCAANWPPLMAGANAMADGDFSLVERKDGAKQWAHKGMPLYLWKNDMKPGDMSGDGVNGVWHTAKAD
ncbi:COG4315 family predicted lipoprotein [Nitratireductor indicus]|uniref:Lipoprotein n=1 Tax=Nitratireductor indicus C115 TaxID=1231190 RepID=K2PIJ4_9HYPH|nr:hypothetical protein [Nitratireductor indicus]EKF40982.1 hypothetical protein NA8A_17475 [Nitratireductor indicus C115]MDS1135004.1 hypothetical protein [Nitratireductor indicus]SFQ73602.1 Predicted lipoprotein with conserved Yx(FWY)xxD motif [Nitratireductor indicus]